MQFIKLQCTRNLKNLNGYFWEHPTYNVSSMHDSDILFEKFMRLEKLGNTSPLPQNFQLWTNLISVLINLKYTKVFKICESTNEHQVVV